MAQGFPSFILDNVLKQLGSPIFQTNKLNCLLHIQLRHLRLKLELIRDVVDDAEGMGVLFPDHVGKWVCELQHLLHEVEDLLDESLTRSMPASDVAGKLRIHLCNLPHFSLTVARKMKKMNERLDRIVEKCYECNLFVVEQPSEPQPAAASTTSSMIGGLKRRPVPRKWILRYDPPDNVEDDEEFHMIGRDDTKKSVVDVLCGRKGGSDFIWVTGLPGVGKTTLCRAVYDDVEVRERFDIRLWVSFGDVSDSPKMDLWKRILAALGTDEEALQPRLETYDLVRGMIASKLHNKKTLFVFDNLSLDIFPIRHHNIKDLYGLKDLTATSQKGSKILLPLVYQSRLCFILNNYGDSVFELNNDLSEDHSWSIFEKAALVSGRDRQMTDLGKEIVAKCVKNPALLMGVGTLLYGNNDTATWDHFARCFRFDHQYECYVEISMVGHYLPKCHHNIGYLSLFTRDEAKKMSLIHQFAAHGFANLSAELQRRLRQTTLKFSAIDNWDGEDTFEVKFNRLHYFLRTDCRYVPSAWTESVTIQFTADGLLDYDHLESARHVSIVRPSSSTEHEPRKRILRDNLIEDTAHRRTLLFSGQLPPIRMSVQTLDKLSSNLRHLRVLDLHDLALPTLPSSIGNLIHLRYLDLSRNEFRMLPASICRLKNLLTLKLVYCDKLIKLPRRIDALCHLKNLEINMCLDLTHMPSTMGTLTCLERLDQFVVSPHKGGLRYLEHLDNLNRDLAIDLPRRWKKSSMEAEQAKLEKKEGLTALRFKWPSMDNGGDEADGVDNDHVLDKLKPCTSTKSLTIANFGGTKFPSWMVESSSLSEIIISNCKRCKILPLFHGMPELCRLTLTSMKIEYLQDYSRSSEASCVVSSDVSAFFPSLKELKIGEMPNLKGWSKDLNGLPKFRNIDSLSIWSCPGLTLTPPFFEIKCSMALQDVSEKMLQLLDWGEKCKVSITSIPNMTLLPNRFVNKLPRELIIKDCHQMQMLWANDVEGSEARKSMANLQKLGILNCHALNHVSSNLRQLMCLKKLEISNCGEELDCFYGDEDSNMPWAALRSLWLLEITSFKKLVALPKGLRHLSKLCRLDIMDCKALKWEAGRLPPGLQELCIKSCPLFSERIEEIRRGHPHLTLLDEEVQHA